MSAQALSQVTLRRTRLLYIPIKKIMTRTNAIRIIQPIMSEPHAGRYRCTKPVRSIYVAASMAVKKGRLSWCVSDTAIRLLPLAYSSPLVYAAPCISRSPFSMLFKTLSASVYGIDAYLVEVEVDVGSARMTDFN